VRKNEDVLTEWKWQQGFPSHIGVELTVLGLPKGEAQQQFIEQAQRMGIRPVSWEVPTCLSPTTTLSPGNCYWGREDSSVKDVSTQVGYISRKLRSRSNGVPEISSSDRSESTKPLSWSALELFTTLSLSLLSRVYDCSGPATKRWKTRRSHARDWNITTLD